MKRLEKLNEQFSFDYLEKLNKAFDYSFFDRDPKFKNSLFELTTIKTPFILTKNLEEELDLYIIEGYSNDSEINIIGDLIDLINDNISLVPIVVDKNNEIIDGFHRCAAYNYLGIKSIKVFKEV